MVNTSVTPLTSTVKGIAINECDFCCIIVLKMYYKDMERVVLRRCPDYSSKDLIKKIILEGIEELNIKPQGKILIKPNVVFAHKRYGRHGFTNPVILEALCEILGQNPEVKTITIGERTAVTIPTRYSFQQAGYYYLLKKPKVNFCYFEEDKKVPVELRKATLHKQLYLARTIVNSDFKIYAPKLKNHASTQITCALKLNIGILDSKERLNGHDYRLEEKIADLYEVGYPDFVVVDAIDIGQQGELVPKPLRLGTIVMGKNGLAVDTVCARILNLEPDNVKHIKILRERGWEPGSENDIEIKGDVTVEELKEKTKSLDRTFNDLREIDFPVKIYLGHYPGGNEICNTGCANMLKTCFAIMDANAPGCLKKARPISIVVGEYEGDVDGGDEAVILVGDCTKVTGTLKGKPIRRVKKCPVTVPFFMNTAAYYMGVKNPYFDINALLLFPYYTLLSLSRKAIANLIS